MVIPMARPWKHPKTGVYYFRKRVPAGLVRKVGRAIEKGSLGTKNEREANKLFTLVAAEYEHRWEQLRSIPVERVLPEIKLGPRQITALSGQIHDELMDKYGDDPGDVSIWVEKLRSAAIRSALLEEADEVIFRCLCHLWRSGAPCATGPSSRSKLDAVRKGSGLSVRRPRPYDQSRPS